MSISARFFFALSILVIGVYTVLVFPSAIPAQQAVTNADNIINRVSLPEKPAFSIQPGFYSSAVELEITHPDPEVILYYTTDGSEPTENSDIYQEPILLTDPSGRPNNISTIPTNIDFNWFEPGGLVKKANVIRVKAVKSGQDISETVTGTWFIDPMGENRYSMRVVSIATDSTHFFSDETGIYVPGNRYEPGQQDWLQRGNFSQRGGEWERPASIEIFDEDGNLFHSQNIGVRIHGGITRTFAQKSLRLYARSDYGESRFNTQIFAGLDEDHFNRLVLRNSGNDWRLSMFRDAAAMHLVRHFNGDTQAYQPSIVFINGEYWGIHNFRERYDRHYLERVYGVDPGNIDYLTVRNEVKEGNNVRYNEMIDFLQSNDLSDDSLFGEVETLMDMDNFLDYYSAQIYYANSDWPHNNIDFWRYRTPHIADAPVGHDGRWRWLLYDVDRSLGLGNDYTFNMIEHVTGIGSIGLFWPNTILNNLLENDGFRHQFLNRIADHLNTAFLPERVHHIVDSLKTLVEPEIEEHIDRWSHPVSVSRWQTEVDIMNNTASNRPEFVRKHLMDHFEIESLVELTIAANNPEQGTVHVNSIAIDPTTPGIKNNLQPWTGIYFGDIPVTLKAEPAPGYRFSHWSGDLPLAQKAENENPEIKIATSESASITAHFREELPAESDPHELIQYWVFTDDLPNNTPLEFVEPVFSAARGAMIEYRPVISPYPPESGTGGIMDRVNDPTELNYLPEANSGIPYEESDMRGIRVRNPSLINGAESSLVLHLPTTGFDQIELSFPTTRTRSGQRELIVEYSTDRREESWTQEGLEKTTAHMFEVWHLNTFSFADIHETRNNPFFKVRLRFGAVEEFRTGDDGNVRFNNILLKGVNLVDEPAKSTERLILHQNMPNPFNSRTIITYRLLEESDIRLDVFDMLGRRVKTLFDGAQNRGNHFVEFDASALASGVYIYRLQTGTESAVQKMTYIK